LHDYLFEVSREERPHENHPVGSFLGVLNQENVEIEAHIAVFFAGQLLPSFQSYEPQVSYPF
jgi:hypothetical protein